MTRGVTSILVMALWVVSCGGSSPSQLSGSPRAPSATLDPESPYRTTREEFLLRAKACVEDKGFPVTLDLADAGFKFSLGTNERARQANAALRECMIDIDPLRLGAPPPIPADQLRAWYEYRLRQADCLRDAGYPPPETPPEQVFVDTAGSWDPFQALLDAGMSPSQDDMARCQQLIDGRPGFLNW